MVAILNGKTALKYAGPEVDAMRAVSKAAKNRSLKEFEAAVQAHPRGTRHALPPDTVCTMRDLTRVLRGGRAMGRRAVLSDDPMVKSHLNDLYNTLLEQNLSRLIEPFSRVEIAHIAELIDLPVRQVENKYVGLGGALMRAVVGPVRAVVGPVRAVVGPVRAVVGQGRAMG